MDAQQTNFDIMLLEAIDNLHEKTVGALTDKVQLSNALGDVPFGVTRDWSKAQPSLREVGMQDELVEDILKRFDNANLGTLRKMNNGDWVMEGITWGTKAPDWSTDDNSCCFTEKFTMQVTGDATPIRYLCFKDCENRLDRMLKDKVHFKQGDLLNLFQQLGMSYEESEQFMAWYTFAYIVQRHIVQGMLNFQGQGLRPFAGVAEMMSHPGVTPIDAGGSVIGAFRQVACYLDVLDNQSSRYKIYVHPLTLKGIKSAIVPGKDGQLPQGWSVNGESLSFKGIPFGTSYHLPFDMENTMTGEAYIIDLSKVEALTQYDLFVPQESIYTTRTEVAGGMLNGEGQVPGCEVVCDKYENFGLVHTNSPISHILVANIPLDSTCPAVLFERIQESLYGLNPFPMATIPNK